jgi:hypothetical protein
LAGFWRALLLWKVWIGVGDGGLELEMERANDGIETACVDQSQASKTDHVPKLDSHGCRITLCIIRPCCEFLALRGSIWNVICA